MNNWSLETLRIIVQKQSDRIKEQDRVMDGLTNEVNSLKQDMNKYFIKSNSLSEDIKNLQERLDYLEGRHI